MESNENPQANCSFPLEDMTRPKFMTRQEREAAALKRRAEQVEKQMVSLPGCKISHKRIDKGDSDDTQSSTLSRKELEEIKNRYLGIQSVTTRRKKQNTDKKFVFDWNDKDDTSKSADFDLAKIAGFDQEERQKQLVDKLMRGNEDDQKRAKQLIDMNLKRKQRINWDEVPWFEKPLALMKERDWRIFKEDFQISVRGQKLPNPLRNWKEANLPPLLFEVIKKIGYKDPSPIQRAAIPIGLQNRDLIGIAETGSGKTAAFIIPALVHISKLPKLTDYNKNDGPYAIVLAPTRELAQQIEAEAMKLALALGFRVVSIVGGHEIEEQARKISEGAHIIIATPGRLIDCLERHLLVLSQCAHVTLDEADRMIDMGFEESVNTILNNLPASSQKPDSELAEDVEHMANESYRQTIMFSATFPPTLEKIAQNYLRRPAIVTIGNPGQATDRIDQRVELFMDSNEERREEKKRRRIEEILESGRFDPPIIIFVNLKKNCDILIRHLSKIGWNAVTLHGGKSQEQRESSLARLRSGDTDCLVATDLAGRGIDIADVSLVLNYNMAKSIEDYTHRIGRTGRAGKHGVSISFLCPEDKELFYDVKQAITKSPVSKLPDELRKHEFAQQKRVNLT